MRRQLPVAVSKKSARRNGSLATQSSNHVSTLGRTGFGVEHGKQTVKRHGIVTKKYIDYNRRDVLANSELAVKLLEEYDKHPVDLQATKAYSPASIGKSYLRAMGIPPILERQPSFPKRYLGYAQSAFFGGRTSAHIRKVPVPVVYTDFLSMYPTVNSLMDLWSFVTANEIKIVEHCQAEVEIVLRQVTVDALFKPAIWKRLTAFVRIIPDGDILPSRGRYSIQSDDWQMAVNQLYGCNDSPDEALWFSLPDVVASVLLNEGRIPEIVDAFRIEPHGRLRGLKSTKLRGQIDVDPGKQDFFRVVIEERKRLPRRTGIFHCICTSVLSHALLQQRQHEASCTRNQRCKRWEAIRARLVRMGYPTLEGVFIHAVAGHLLLVVGLQTMHFRIDAVACCIGQDLQKFVELLLSDIRDIGIWKVPMDGGVPVRLTYQLSGFPAVSPDGKSIAYTYFDPKVTPRQRLAIIAFDGGAPTKVFGIDADTPAIPRWMPDGRSILYTKATLRTFGTNRFQEGSRSRSLTLTKS
jgi:hypothetical protein